MRRKTLSRLVQRTFGDLLRKRRKGAGRKKSPDSGVSHLKRELVTSRTPALITLKIRELLPDLRTPEAYRVIRRVLKEACMRPGRRETGGFRIVHFAILGSRVGPGRFQPGPPTDPDVRNSRIRLLGAAGLLRAPQCRVDGVGRG